MITPSGHISYLHMMLHGNALREFNKLAIQNGGSTNNHLKIITEGLLGNFFPINTLSNKKRAMTRVMRQPRKMEFKRFDARLTKMNNFLPLLHGSDVTKNITPEDLNKILLHVVPNAWAETFHIQGWDFKMKTYK